MLSTIYGVPELLEKITLKFELLSKFLTEDQITVTYYILHVKIRKNAQRQRQFVRSLLTGK